MEQNIKKVAVVCNYRTGSTTFTLQKAEEYGIPYGGEAFSHEKANQVGSIPARHKLQQAVSYTHLTLPTNREV